MITKEVCPPDAGAVGKYVRALRLQRDLTIAQLAADTGMTSTSLTIWELGGRATLPRPDTLGRVAAALGVTWRELLDAGGEA